MLWARNLLFVALCLLGVALVGREILRQDRISTPQSFTPSRFQVRSVSSSQPTAAAAKPGADSSADPASAARSGRFFSSREPQDWGVVLERFNQEFEEHWKKQGLEKTPAADSFTIARRLSLGLTGTIPSLEEVRALEQVDEQQRVEWYVSRLLEDRRFADYWAERLARVYVGNDMGPFLVFRRRLFVTWLSEHLAENKPYDDLVRQLVSDNGLWNGSPAVNFVTATSDPNRDNQPDEIKLAGKTARAFLGMRIDCLQCHDDKLGTINLGERHNPHGGAQANFHELAAFFGEARVGLTGVQNDNKLKYEYKYLDAEKEELIPAKVPFAQHLVDGHGTRREQLARWITHPENKAFARATVNRVWALMFGRALMEPIDDLPLYGKYPPAMELLADDFIAHGYDLQRMIRLIAASEPFQRDSRADFEITEKHDEQWASFPLSRLRPEQVAGSLVQSASASTINADSHVIAQLVKFFQTREFVERYGDMGQDEFTDRGGTITQRLLMMNGELVKERTGENIVMNAATRMAVLGHSDEAAVEAAYLALFTRYPDGDERTHFAAKLQGKRNQARIAAMEDIYWILVNSTEFSWNH